MSAVTAVSQRYTRQESGVRKWCDGGRDRYKLNILDLYFSQSNEERN